MNVLHSDAHRLYGYMVCTALRSKRHQSIAAPPPYKWLKTNIECNITLMNTNLSF